MPSKRLFVLALSFFLLQALCVAAGAQEPDRARAAAEIESLREQIKQREPILFAPPREDYEAHAEFLSQAGTGLVRLMPREKWDSKLSTRGGGSYYSFHALTHEYGDASDISLEQGNFRVGFHGVDFGFFYAADDLALEEVTLEHASAQFLVSFSPPSALTEVEKIWRWSGSEGIRSGEFVYRKTAPVVAGKTYLLRSISYGDADTLVAFRVLRKDTDGSVVLLWKTLKKFPKPSIEKTATAAGR